jgi:arginine repressor
MSTTFLNPGKYSKNIDPSIREVIIKLLSSAENKYKTQSEIVKAVHEYYKNNFETDPLSVTVSQPTVSRILYKIAHKTPDGYELNNSKKSSAFKTFFPSNDIYCIETRILSFNVTIGSEKLAYRSLKNLLDCEIINHILGDGYFSIFINELDYEYVMECINT